MTQKKVIALVQTKVNYYESCMEGADGDEFIQAEFALGAMLQLLRELKNLYEADAVPSKVTESQASLKLTETEACKKLNLIAIPIDDSATAVDVCKSCVLYKNDWCRTVDCMTNNVYFKQLVP